ncbi:MAG: peptidoglycan-binding protein [Pseudomonadota bacterium]
MSRRVRRNAAALAVALSAALWGAFGSVTAALADDIALVVTNLRFDEAKTLPASVREGADRLTRALSRFGYEVYGGVNLGTGDLRQALAGFSRAAETADRVVIYYAGHALTTSGNTWLAGTETRPTIANASATGADLDLLLALARLARLGGLLVLETGEDGFVTNGPIENGVGRLRVPADVMVVQGRANRLAGQVTRAFLGSGLTARQAARDLSPGVTVSGDLPPGLRFGEADPVARLKRLEDRIGLDQEGRARVQVHLTILELSPGPIDGIFGPRTRTAIGRWQRRSGLAETGYLDDDQRLQLRSDAQTRRAELVAEAERARTEAERQDRLYWRQTGQTGEEDGIIAYLRRYPNGIHAERARAILARMNQAHMRQAQAAERDAWQQARSLDTIAGYNRYLQVYPGGLFVRSARARLEVLREDAVAANRHARFVAQEESLGLNRLSLVRIERRLQVLGFNSGPADGTLDRQARRSIRAYQRSRGIQPTGFLNEGTLRLIIAETS